MTDHGLVSIIMPNYNGAAFLGEAIQSVLSQTYPFFELLVIDDCSVDESLSILDSFRDPRIHVMKNEQNLGPGGSRNRGIAAASGRFLAFLDSDDVWFPEKLEKQVGFMISRDAAFSCHGYCVCAETMDHVVKEYLPPDRVTCQDVLRNNTIGCLSSMVDITKTGRVYMPTGRCTREDMVTWLRVLEKCGECVSVGEILGKYRVRAQSFSGNKLKLVKVQYAMYRKDLGFSRINAAKYLIISIFEKLLYKY